MVNPDGPEKKFWLFWPWCNGFDIGVGMALRGVSTRDWRPCFLVRHGRPIVECGLSQWSSVVWWPAG